MIFSTTIKKMVKADTFIGDYFKAFGEVKKNSNVLLLMSVIGSSIGVGLAILAVVMVANEKNHEN